MMVEWLFLAVPWGCLRFVMLLRLFIAALWSSAGKGLASWLLFVMFYCVFVPFPYGILGQVWYLIVLITDLCPLYSHKNVHLCEQRVPSSLRSMERSELGTIGLRR